MTEFRTTVSRQVSLSGRRVKAENLFEIARVLEREYADASKARAESQSDKPGIIAALKEAFARPTLRFQVSTEGDMKFESESADIFGPSGVFPVRRVLSVDMEFSAGGNRVSIDVTHGNDVGFRNKVSIVGSDERWTNGLHGVFQGIVNRIESQANWPERYRILIIPGVCLSLGFFVAQLWQVLFTPADPVEPWAMGVFVVVLGGFLSGFWVADELAKLYPKTEIVSGPEYARTEESARKRLVQIGSLAVAPFLLGLLIEVIRTAF